MGQCIHSGCRGQALWHGGHHFRVHHCNNRDIVCVYTYKFALFLNIRDYIVDGNLCRGSGCGWNCNNRDTWVLGRCNALQAPHILEFRVGNDHANGLGCIHGRTAADCNDIVCSGCLKCSNAGLYILNGWIGFDVGINLICKTSVLQHFCHLAGHVELNQVRVGTDKCFLESPCLCLIGNLRDCACAMIGCLI